MMVAVGTMALDQWYQKPEINIVLYVTAKLFSDLLSVQKLKANAPLIPRSQGQTLATKTSLFASHAEATHHLITEASDKCLTKD